MKYSKCWRTSLKLSHTHSKNNAIECEDVLGEAGRHHGTRSPNVAVRKSPQEVPMWWPQDQARAPHPLRNSSSSLIRLIPHLVSAVSYGARSTVTFTTAWIRYRQTVLVQCPRAAWSSVLSRIQDKKCSQVWDTLLPGCEETNYQEYANCFVVQGARCSNFRIIFQVMTQDHWTPKNSADLRRASASL